MTQELKNLTIISIDANPWQTRTISQDLVDVLAASIARDGVLQPIMVRPHPTLAGRYQVAFGHHRLAAAKKAGRTTITAEVRQRGDRELAELAIRENSERRDLSPIEEATAMRRYMDSFNVTPKAAAAVFGIEATTLRKKVQLLELSPKAAAAIDAGQLPERVGRRLVGLSRANPKAADDLAVHLAADPDKSDQEREWQIQRAMEKATTILAGQYDRGQVKGQLWALDAGFTKSKDVQLSPAEIAKAIEHADGVRQAKALAATITDRFAQGLTVEELVQLYDLNRAAVEIIGHLQAPPVCTACTYHTEIADQHFCALKACFDLKRRTFIARQAATGVRASGLAVYSRKDDGPMMNLSDDYNLRDRVKALATGKEKGDLRAKPRGTPAYHTDPVTKSKWVDVVAVGKLATRLGKSRSQPGGGVDYEAERKKRELKREATERVLRLATPHFAPLFASISDWWTIKLLEEAVNENFYGYQAATNPALPDTARYFDFDDKKATPAQRVVLYQLQLAHRALPNLIGGKTWNKGAAAVAKAIPGIAKALGVRLPEGWDTAQDVGLPSPETLERRQLADEAGVDEDEVELVEDGDADA